MSAASIPIYTHRRPSYAMIIPPRSSSSSPCALSHATTTPHRTPAFIFSSPAKNNLKRGAAVNTRNRHLPHPDGNALSRLLQAIVARFYRSNVAAGAGMCVGLSVGNQGASWGIVGFGKSRVHAGVTVGYGACAGFSLGIGFQTQIGHILIWLEDAFQDIFD